MEPGESRAACRTFPERQRAKGRSPEASEGRHHLERRQGLSQPGRSPLPLTAWYNGGARKERTTTASRRRLVAACQAKAGGQAQRRSGHHEAQAGQQTGPGRGPKREGDKATPPRRRQRAPRAGRTGGGRERAGAETPTQDGRRAGAVPLLGLSEIVPQLPPGLYLSPIRRRISL